MSATARRHRRRAGQWKVDAALQESLREPAVSVGILGAHEMVMKGTVMYLVARPLPGMPTELVEALALRRQATLDGTCACGGRRHAGPRRSDHIAQGHFLHTEKCPAHDRAIDSIAERHGWELSS